MSNPIPIQGHYFPLNESDAHYDKDWFEYVQESFIQPLAELGYELKSSISTKCEETTTGTHILTFEQTRDDMTITDKHLRKICIQDDDNQPYSTFQTYIGTLWLFIPFTG